MSGVSDGAKAGAAFGPWGAAAGAVLGGVADVASSGGGPQLQSAAVDARSFMDGSGWTVSTGSSKSTGGDRTQEGDGMLTSGSVAASQPLAAFAPSQAGGVSFSTLLLLLVAGGIVWKLRQ